MTGALHLTITTPLEVAVDAPSVLSVRAEDESGAFGVLPGHTDLMTVLPASVLRWRGADGRTRYCGVRAGLLTVTDGTEVRVACREAVPGDDLAALERRIAALRTDQEDESRKARVEQMRLHANAVRQMMRLLRPGRTDAFAHPEGIETTRGADG